MLLPPEKQTLLDTIVRRLSRISGVQALALGGSFARGTARPDSDLDIALYYSESDPFDLAEVRRAAAEISIEGESQVTDFYGWGAWVNGGAWIHTAAGKVDFIYRNLEQVQRVISEANQGVLRHDYDQQPAYGFYSVIYLGETHVCRPLHDPRGLLPRLKAQVAEYPPRLKEKIVQSSLWLAEFTLAHGFSYAQKGDVYTTAGSLTRAAAYLTQALFALNETYFINDKTALSEMQAFPLLPPDYPARLSAVLSRPGLSPEELNASVRALHGLWGEVVGLTGGTYAPAFRL